jgi:hypothetical protein
MSSSGLCPTSATAATAVPVSVAFPTHGATNYDASQFGAKKMISPQFGGELKRTQMESANDGNPNHFTLHITFGVSERIQHLATVFGDRVALNAFKKAGEDLFPDVAEGELGREAKAVEASGNDHDFDSERNEKRGAVKLTMTKLQ